MVSFSISRRMNPLSSKKCSSCTRIAALEHKLNEFDTIGEVKDFTFSDSMCAIFDVNLWMGCSIGKFSVAFASIDNKVTC